MKSPNFIQSSISSTHRDVVLFFATFLSMGILLLGIVAAASMFAPVMTSIVSSQPAYYPQLPLSAERDEPFAEYTEAAQQPSHPPLESVERVEEGNWIRIPSIDVNVPLVLSPTMNDNDVIQTLTHGAAMYPNGVLPGDTGNTFIAAHSTGEPWRGTYRFAFLRINELVDGHVIHLDWEGVRYTYRIRTKEIITPTADMRISSVSDKPTITLMACWPLWSTSQRMLVHGELTHITPLNPPLHET